MAVVPIPGVSRSSTLSNDTVPKAKGNIELPSNESFQSTTPLVVVSEESKYARVEAVRGPRPPPTLDQRVEYKEIDLKVTKVS